MCRKLLDISFWYETGNVTILRCYLLAYLRHCLFWQTLWALAVFFNCPVQVLNKVLPIHLLLLHIEYSRQIGGVTCLCNCCAAVVLIVGPVVSVWETTLLLRRKLVKVVFIQKRQVHRSEWWDHVFFAITFFNKFIVTLGKFTNFLLRGILSWRQKIRLVVWVLFQMLYFLLAI